MYWFKILKPAAENILLFLSLSLAIIHHSLRIERLTRGFDIGSKTGRTRLGGGEGWGDRRTRVTGNFSEDKDNIAMSFLLMTFKRHDKKIFNALIRNSIIELTLSLFHLMLSPQFRDILEHRTREFINMKLVWLASQCCQSWHKLYLRGFLMKTTLNLLLGVAMA